MSEPIDMLKFGKSFFEGTAWVKNLRYIVGGVIILFVCLTVYRAFFMKTTKSMTTVRVERGATAVINQNDSDGHKWRVYPYVDAAYVKGGSNRESWNGAEDGWQVMAGVRCEFDGLFDWLVGKW